MGALPACMKGRCVDAQERCEGGAVVAVEDHPAGLPVPPGAGVDADRSGRAVDRPALLTPLRE